MFTTTLPRFRQDLSITQTENPTTQARAYLIRDPRSGDTFEFGEQQFFLCQSLDGLSTGEQILDKFYRHFSFPITPQEFEDFLGQLKQLNLLDLTASPFEEDEDDDDEDLGIGLTSANQPRWSWLTVAAPLMNAGALVLRPLEPFFPFLTWTLLPLGMISCWLWFNNQALIETNLDITKNLVSFVIFILLFLLTVNLLTKLLKGSLGKTYGGVIKDFGLQLRWGFVPRFYVKIGNISRFNRKQQFWFHGSPLVLRLILFIVGTFVWYLNSGRGNSLAGWGIFFAEMGLLSFLSGALPLRLGSPGSKLLCLYFRKPASYPRQLFYRAMQQFFAIFKRNPDRGLFLSKEEVFFLFLGIGIFALLTYIVVSIGLRFAAGLSSSFPVVFGNGTFWIILCVLLYLSFNYFKKLFQERALTVNTPYSPIEFSERSIQPARQATVWGRVFNLKTLFLLALVVILALPMPYTPGGPIQLVPPQQQQIQAPISGKVVQVLFNGGDGTWIKTGTVIAQMISTDLQNEVLQIQEQIKEQKANVEKQQANLNKLLAGSRSEEVDVIRAQVEVSREAVGVAKSQVEITREELQGAKAQVEIAKEELQGARVQIEIAEEELQGAGKELESAVVSAKYSKNEVSRLEKLYQEGAFSLQTFEDAKKRSETDSILVQQRQKNFRAKEKNVEQMQQNFQAKEKNVEQMQQNFQAKEKNVEQMQKNFQAKEKELKETQAQLNLALSGSLPQDIEGARQELEAARSTLRGLEQQLKYTRDKEKSTALIMPFDGYLVDAYLKTKVGSFLNQGAVFAVAQYDRKLLAELQLPEYDASEIHVGADAQVKLLINPNENMAGKVVSIEPATAEVEDAYSRVVKVLIGLTAPQQVLKPGLSGYGKINLGNKPLIVILTRPLVRFIQVELWSWLP